MSTAKITIWDKVVGYLYWDERNNRALFEADEENIKTPFKDSIISGHFANARMLLMLGQRKSDWYGAF